MQIYEPFASISKGTLVLSLACMQEERHIENFEKVSQNSYGITLQTLSMVESHWMGALYGGTQPRKVNFVRTQFISTLFYVWSVSFRRGLRGNPAWAYKRICSRWPRPYRGFPETKLWKSVQNLSSSYDIELLCLFLSIPHFSLCKHAYFLLCVLYNSKSEASRTRDTPLLPTTGKKERSVWDDGVNERWSD